MALQAFNESLELSNSLLEDVKTEVDQISSFVEKVIDLHESNEETVKRLLDVEEEIFQSLTQEYANREENLKEKGFSESILKVSCLIFDYSMWFIWG